MSDMNDYSRRNGATAIAEEGPPAAIAARQVTHYTTRGIRTCLCGIDSWTCGTTDVPAMVTCRKCREKLSSAKDIKPPLCTGLLDYFPLALAEVSKVSMAGNGQHGTVGWERDKSPDHENGLLRHWVLRGDINPDSGLSHTAHAAWRALAYLQLELEKG